MRFVGYVKSGGRDPQDRMMGVVIDGNVAPLKQFSPDLNLRDSQTVSYDGDSVH